MLDLIGRVDSRISVIFMIQALGRRGQKALVIE
jgi:hypothetical protein